MDHLNDHVPVVIGAMYTTSDLDAVEVIEICMIPLKYDLTVDTKRHPFIATMSFSDDVICTKSDFVVDEERGASSYILQRESVRAHRKRTGYAPGTVADLFEKWAKTFKFKHRKRFMPIVYDWALTQAAMRNWLGYATFDTYFDWRYRDILNIASYLNDLAGVRNFIYPVQKLDFQSICRSFRVKRVKIDGTYSATENAKAIAKIWKLMLSEGFYCKEYGDILKSYEQIPEQPIEHIEDL